jgi:hypothetical protein
MVEKFKIKVSDKIHCNVVNYLLWAQVRWHEKTKYFRKVVRNAGLNEQVSVSNINPEVGYPTFPEGFPSYSKYVLLY